MCLVSAVHDFARGFPKDIWTVPQIGKYEELIDTIKKLDKDLGLPDCEDPEKASLLKELAELKERLAKAEKEIAEIKGAEPSDA